MGQVPILANLQLAWSGSALQLQFTFNSHAIQFHSGRHRLSKEQRSGPPDKRPDFHMASWVDSGLHGGLSGRGIVGSLPMETTYLSMGVLISSGQQWENASLPKTGELLVKQAAACPTVKPNLQKECWSPL